VFVVAAVVVARRQGARAAAGCVLIYAAAAGVEWWAIRQSRSSTAGIGFLFLPTFAAIIGLLGIGFVSSRRSSARVARAAGIAMGILAVLAIALEAASGVDTIRRNRARDAAAAAIQVDIDDQRRRLSELLSINKGAETQAMEREIRAHHANRAFMIAALETPFVPPAILDSLANSPDLNIALEAVRNPAVTPATLERVYRTRADADYFAQAIAANPRTPGPVLSDLYRRPNTSPRFDAALADNPATPADVIQAIAATTKDSSVRQKLAARQTRDPGP
jgi:hypothetical protein